MKTINPRQFMCHGFQITNDMDSESVFNKLSSLKTLIQTHNGFTQEIEDAFDTFVLNFDPSQYNYTSPCVTLIVNEKIESMYVNDWLIFTGFNLTVVSSSLFEQMFFITS